METLQINQTEKTLLTMLLKTKLPKTKKIFKKDVAPVVNFTSIVNQIKGSAQDRGSMFAFGDSIFNKIEMLADEQGHFAGSITEDARNGKFITDKQACVVAYFAKNNGLIK